MAKNATPNQRRRPGRKAEDMHRAWKEQAPEAEFAGKSLADLEAAITALEQISEDLRIRDQARSAALRTRDAKKKELAGIIRVIARGVEGHPAHGDDSPLYRAMGFVPFSERGSGLTRKSAGGDATGEKETAA